MRQKIQPATEVEPNLEPAKQQKRAHTKAIGAGWGRESGTTSYREKGALKPWNNGSCNFQLTYPNLIRTENLSTNKPITLDSNNLRRHEREPPATMPSFGKETWRMPPPAPPSVTVYTHLTTIIYRESGSQETNPPETTPQENGPFDCLTTAGNRGQGPHHQSENHHIAYLIGERQKRGAPRRSDDTTSESKSFSERAFVISKMFLY